MKASFRFPALVIGLAAVYPAGADPSSIEVKKFEQLPMIRTIIDEQGYPGHDEISTANLNEQVGSTNAYIGNWMADDFADTVESDIVHVEWWGSYFNNQVPPVPSRFLIEFLSDFPDTDGPGPAFSRPDRILYTQVVRYASAPGHPPPGYYTETVVPGSRPDEMVYYYNAHLKTPFHQLSNTVYWLKIVALGEVFAPVPWGWHNRDYTIRNELAGAVSPGERITGTVGSGTNVWHFQDNAVASQQPLFVAVETNTDTVVFLQENTVLVAPQFYVLPHDGPTGIQTNSKDLAFALYYETPPCPKWVQEPDCNIGVDVQSCVSLDEQFLPTLVADDWLCDGRPVTGVRWWGSYVNWQSDVSNAVPCPLNRPVGFRIYWFTDIPAAGANFSRPGALLKYENLLLSPFGVEESGKILETNYCETRLAFAGTNVFEHEYVYEATFTNAWNEKEGNIYWLGVQAIYLNIAQVTNLWGWKTTPPQWNWNDDAVQIGVGFTNEMRYPPPGWTVYTNHPYRSNSVNMAYHLLTDVCPARCTKWSQSPDLVFGADFDSFTFADYEASTPLRADDFISDGRPITDIHWWGSYGNYLLGVPGSETNPTPAPTGVSQPLGFNLSWHADSNCVPGALLTNVFVEFQNCHEVYFGNVTQYWHGPNVFEHEYQYYVDLANRQVAGGPWLETNGGHYWLNVQAVFSTNFFQNPQHAGWGWKKTYSVTNCPSLETFDGGSNWFYGVLAPPHPQAFQAIDMSFELTTTNIATNAVSPIRFRSITTTQLLNTVYMTSTGHCGCGVQVLQASTNLLLGEPGWLSLYTNPLPREDGNVWTATPVTTQRFFRIQKRN